MKNFNNKNFWIFPSYVASAKACNCDKELVK